MVIYSRKKIKKPALKKKTIEEPAVVKEEVKIMINNENINHKKRNKKTASTAPIIEEPVIEEKNEDVIDLSEWLKDEIEE